MRKVTMVKALVAFIAILFINSFPIQAQTVSQQVIKNGHVQTIDIEVTKEKIVAKATKNKVKEKKHTQVSSKIQISRIQTGVWLPNSIEDIKANMDAQGITSNNVFDNIMYQIQYGDTLSQISQIVGVGVDDLSTYNNILNPDKIYVGDAIQLHK